MEQKDQPPEESLDGQPTAIVNGSEEGFGNSNEPSSRIPLSAPPDSLGNSSTSNDATTQTPEIKTVKVYKNGSLWSRINIYLLLFILIVVSVSTVTVVAVIKNDTAKPSGTTAISSQDLSSSALQELAKNNVTVGDPKQTLNIESNAVFAGTALIRGDLQVAGTIKAGSSLSLPGISVSGTSKFEDVQIKTLTVSGNTAVQGELRLQNSLNVGGNGTFSGTVTAPTLRVTNLQLNGQLTLNDHLTAGGPIPSRANGSALGSGGTSSVSGSDTAGSISIQTGGHASSGCLVTITFVKTFSTTPHVAVTPIGSAAGSLDFYVNRSTTSMSVCTNNAAPSGQSFGFDYIILD